MYLRDNMYFKDYWISKEIRFDAAKEFTQNGFKVD